MNLVNKSFTYAEYMVERCPKDRLKYVGKDGSERPATEEDIAELNIWDMVYAIICEWGDVFLKDGGKITEL